MGAIRLIVILRQFTNVGGGGSGPTPDPPSSKSQRQKHGQKGGSELVVELGAEERRSSERGGAGKEMEPPAMKSQKSKRRKIARYHLPLNNTKCLHTSGKYSITNDSKIQDAHHLPFNNIQDTPFNNPRSVRLRLTLQDGKKRDRCGGTGRESGREAESRANKVRREMG